jgi:hypothetical protein
MINIQEPGFFFRNDIMHYGVAYTWIKIDTGDIKRATAVSELGDLTEHSAETVANNVLKYNPK